MARSAVWVGTAALVAVAVSVAATAASAETLNEAMATAYANNPTLQAARAQLRQVDEQVPQALSNWRPTVNIQGDIGPEWEKDTIRGANDKTNSRVPKSAFLSLTQPIYRGGRTVAQRDQAENPRQRRTRPADECGAADPAAGGDRLCRRAARHAGARADKEQRTGDR